MRNVVQKSGVLVAALLFALAVFSPLAYAASSDVGIEPAYPVEGNDRTQSIFIMSLKPGEEGKNGIRLINSGQEAHTVNVYPVDSSVSADGSFSCRQKAEQTKAVGTWIKLDKTDLTLEPGEQTVVDFTVTVPEKTGPGEHNGCIAVQDQGNLPAKTGEGILLGFRSAIRLSITTPGEIVKKLTLDRVDVQRQKDGSYQVSPIAKNEGNVSLDVKSYAQLRSVFGQLSPLKNDATCIVMPEATMACPYVFERPYWGGIYRVKTSLSYNADPTAGIGQNTSDQQRVRKDSNWFIALPDPLAGAAELAVVLAVLWLLITPLRRRLRRLYVLKHWEKYTVNQGDTLMSVAAARGARWRQIAKRNRIKAPYLLEAGQIIIVPKRAAAKTSRRQKKAIKSDLDWFVDEPVTSTPTKPTETSVVSESRTLPTYGSAVVAEEHNETPRPTPEPQYGGWVSPRGSSYDQEDEEYDEEFVDWREGADEKELTKIEHRIENAAGIPKIRSQTPKTEPKKRTRKKRS